MEIDPYCSGPTICKICLKQINDSTQLITVNSSVFNADLPFIWQKLPTCFSSDDFNLLVCHSCYATINTDQINKEYFSSTCDRTVFEGTIDENKTELLTYKFLSDILKEEHINNNSEEADYTLPSANFKQKKISQDDYLYLKDAIFSPTLFDNYVGKINSSIDHLPDDIKPSGFGGPADGCNVDFVKEESLVTNQIMQDIESNTKIRHPKSSHRCNICEFNTTTKSKLTIHMATHAKEESHPAIQTLLDEGKTMFRCSQCTYETQFNFELIIHLKSHTGNKPYNCTECKFKCSSKSYLNIHMRIHTGETPYKCEICGFSTAFKYTLSVHMRTHTGAKPYRCTECDFRCSTKGYLETHVRIHTGETPYKCNVCEYSTTFKYTLSIHMRTHLGSKPYQCRECDFKCSSESYLKKHLKGHSGEVYTCSICPYSSTCRATVTHHIKMHTGEKPFKCTKCDYRAYKKYDVRKHMKKHMEKPLKKFSSTVTALSSSSSSM